MTSNPSMFSWRQVLGGKKKKKKKKKKKAADH
jgi:hypothetical protein